MRSGLSSSFRMSSALIFFFFRGLLIVRLRLLVLACILLVSGKVRESIGGIDLDETWFRWKLFVFV